MNLFTTTFHTLEHALNYSATKQKVISQNIANNNTPNYKAKDVSFKSVFQEAINGSLPAKRSDERHYQFKTAAIHPAVYKKNNVKYHDNGNNVDIDAEMSDSARNQIYFNALIDRLNGKFSTLQSVVRGGK